LAEPRGLGVLGIAADDDEYELTHGVDLHLPGGVKNPEERQNNIAKGKSQDAGVDLAVFLF
jgi:hypothetical protein